VTPERWRQVNALFHAAMQRDATGRRLLLAETARTDPELASEVQSLLAVYESRGWFLDEPAWAVAPELMLDPPGPSLAGTTVGHFHVIREIGRGGMGVVYEAEDTRLDNRTVAVKALPTQYTRDPARRERLKREGSAAAKLNHPAIATIYALDEFDGVLYLVSELVRGETLRAEVGRGALAADRLLPTMIPLASGLAAAHTAGIVHRDFKPENIIRCGDGGVKILDFGVARMNNSQATTVLKTETGLVIGTPGYMAPEQLKGKDVDARTDVFAFGVVAWELATGTHPFGSSPAEQLVRMADMLDGRLATGVGPGPQVPGLAAVLRRCLRPDPAERFASAADVLAALNQLQTAAPPPPIAPGAASDRALWWWQFHQALMSIVIASLPVATWFVRRWDAAIGARLFLAVLALSTISVTIRLNLLFTSIVHPDRLASQRARVYTAMASAETLLGLVLLASAALVAGTNVGLAAILVTLAVAIVASLGIIEPATTAAAGLTPDAEQLPTSNSQLPKR
jgi:serine/threonine protein kinase